MEPPSKILEQIAFNTKPAIEERILKVLDKSTHEEHLSQLLQTQKKSILNSYYFLNWLSWNI